MAPLAHFTWFYIFCGAAVLAGVAAVSPMAPSFVIQNDLVSRFFWHALTEVCVSTSFLLESAKVSISRHMH
jgi:hypothetical protein